MLVIELILLALCAADCQETSQNPAEGKQTVLIDIDCSKFPLANVMCGLCSVRQESKTKQNMLENKA